MGVSSFFHLLGASHTSLAEPFVRLSIQVTSCLMNALFHFVHWSLPLFLFLTDIPHGRDINHCNLPPFFSILSDLPSVGLPSPLEYLLSFQFYFLELRIPYCVPPYAFLYRFFSKRLSRSPAEISSNSLRYRAYSFSHPLLHNCREPTEASSIFHSPRSRFINERLPFWVVFLSVSPHFFGNLLSACLTTGRNHRFSYPPFFFSPSTHFGVFPFVVSLRPLADFPQLLLICSSVYSPFF